MNYECIKATKDDISLLKKYKMQTILGESNLPCEEIDRIKSYIEKHVPEQLEDYKIIRVDGKKVGCLLVQNREDGTILDEIYLEDDYRNKGIGTDIIKKVIKDNGAVYLWVYKTNSKARKLYEKLGFVIVDKTESRYRMKCESTSQF